MTAGQRSPIGGVFTAACLTLLLLCWPENAKATRKCAWVRGQFRCNKDPSKHASIEVRLIDRDGIGPLKVIDPDDLMGITFTDNDGQFQLDGCGDDFNWLPGVPNLPDPFIRVYHYCNSAKGETLDLPEFDVFVPETHEIGLVELDNSHGQPGQATGNKVERTKKVVSRPGAGSLSREVASSEEEQEHHANKKNNDKKQREQQVVVVPAGDSENKEKEKYEVSVSDGDLLHLPEASSPLPDKKYSVKEKKATEIRLNDDVSTSTEVERE